MTYWAVVMLHIFEEYLEQFSAHCSWNHYIWEDVCGTVSGVWLSWVKRV